MNAEPQDDPFEAMARNLAELKRDAFGIHAAALQVAAIFEQAERRARRRLIVAITASVLFAATAARLVAIALGLPFAAALGIAALVGMATALSALVVLPWPDVFRRLSRALRTGWRR